MTIGEFLSPGAHRADVTQPFRRTLSVPEWHHRAGRFPVWAIVLISVAGGILGLVIISIAAIVLVRKVRDSKKQPIEI